MKFDRYKKEHRKQFTALMLACTIMVTAVAAGLLTSTAVAADTIITLGSSMTAPTARQLSAAGPDSFRVEDEYGTIWGTDTEIEIFHVSYENDRQEITVAGKNGQKVIAPGTENTYTFALKNNRRSHTEYAVSVEAFVTGLEGTDVTLPVEARLQGGFGWMVGDENTYRPVLELDQVKEQGVVAPLGNIVYTLEWQWPFERDLNGDGSVDDGDALDTWLATQDQDISLSIRISVLYTYRNGGEGGGGEDVLEEDLPLIGPVLGMLNNRDHYAYLYGFHDGTIRPDDEVSRAQVAAIFYRLLKDEVRDKYYSEDAPYPDVTEDAWYRTEVATLSKAGVFFGYDDGYFRGEQTITRAEMASVLARLSEAEIISGRYTGFEDIKGHWAEDEIKTIEGFNWIIGYEDGSFRPDNTLTRAEAATMINRVLRRDPQKLSDLLPNMKTWPDNADTEKWYYVAMQEASNSHDYERLLGSREKWMTLIDNPWNDEYQVERQ